MANKNHELDGLITEAALKEFLDNGFEKASMRKIAANAGVTVGAIYTRYATKDILFSSLVQPLVDAVKEAFATVKADYYENLGETDAHKMLSSIKGEMDMILHLLFDYHECAVLLLCKSGGSSLEGFFDILIEKKIEETKLFFEKSNIKAPDERVMKLIITSQFNMYYHLINEGCELEEAKKITNDIMKYHTGGWLALLND